LDASDGEMKDWCAKNLHYFRDKELDFCGHQNAQFADAISTITSPAVKASTVAILDGVL
jgi:hypothetical protein